ncbi:hypothetical protein G6O69_26875 [Pseudenhygromyxa sp. WMMC2535]|uniref:hypothetical protein n=1 Tax=Pseudenhygromyxa sp. WMMC2535 TaxID=2712867 RepID=UPI001595E1AE|nr:hypothetical protein [Pseudenhygromyxa sp. WMMC2535]NVB41491.1 hypothetical protein [Pseudenhygromyxa sp. WMMC2535]
MVSASLLRSGVTTLTLDATPKPVVRSLARALEGGNSRPLACDEKIPDSGEHDIAVVIEVREPSGVVLISWRIHANPASRSRNR